MGRVKLVVQQRERFFARQRHSCRHIMSRGQIHVHRSDQEGSAIKALTAMSGDRNRGSQLGKVMLVEE